MDAWNKYSQIALLNLFFIVKINDFLIWQVFPYLRKKIWNEILIRVFTNKTHKYGIPILNKLFKLQIDNWGTSSIDLFIFILVSGFFTKIRIFFLKTDFWETDHFNFRRIFFSRSAVGNSASVSNSTYLKNKRKV